MAKHGGFPMGGMGNMQQLMKQAQVTVNGAREVLSVEIDPQCVDPDDVEMLQDLVLSAVNGALKEAAATVEQEMGKLTGGMNMPF